jgi:putative acetyltransferase
LDTRSGQPVTIRPEEPRDADDVRAVHQYAFGRSNEAALVDTLRGVADAISLVAVIDDRVVGHILFTPVEIHDRDRVTPALGLAPMAVLPEQQRRGIGSELVRAGLDACRSHGHAIVIVLGHPAFYPRFGFVPASRHGIACEFSVPADAFMVRELRSGALHEVSGTARYRPEFRSA